MKRLVLVVLLGAALWAAGAVVAQEATSELSCGPGNWNGCSYDDGVGGICDVTHVECGFVAGFCDGTTENHVGSNGWCNTWCSQTYSCRPASIRCNSDADCGCEERCLEGVCDESAPSRCGTPPGDDGGGDVDPRGCQSDRECVFGQRCGSGGCCNSCPAGQVWASPTTPSPTVRAQCTSFPVQTCVEFQDCPINSQCRAVFGLETKICLRVNQPQIP